MFQAYTGKGAIVHSRSYMLKSDFVIERLDHVR